MTTSQKLSDVLQFIRGVTFSPEELVTGDDSGAIACLRTKNIQKELDDSDLIYVPSSVVKRGEQALQEGDLLISSANSWELVGKTVRVGKLSYPATAGGFISILRPDRERIDPDYLFRFISWARTQHEIRHLGRQTTNISNLDRERFLELPIPLPPLPTQRHIAKVLEQADCLRRQAQLMEAELDRLVQALFVDMFGDPVINPKAWSKVSVSHFVDEFEGGKSLVGAGEDQEVAGYRVLKISAVTWGEFNPAESKPLPNDYQPEKSHFVRKCDLLFSRANTTELVGATSYVFDEHKNLLLPDKLWRFVWREEISVSPIFIWFLFMNRDVRVELGKLSSGSGGSMKNISKAKLMRFKVIFPPIALQRDFERKYLKVREALAACRSEAAEHERMYDALMQRAFKGELVPKLA